MFHARAAPEVDGVIKSYWKIIPGIGFNYPNKFDRKNDTNGNQKEGLLGDGSSENTVSFRPEIQ
jgi:hypothetical protein